LDRLLRGINVVNCVLLKTIFFMFVAIVISVIPSTAMLADKRPLFGVSPIVVLHVALGPEPEATIQGTRERAFVTVDEHVSLQIIFVRKSSQALHAAEWVVPVMNMHVSREFIQSRELPPTLFTLMFNWY
jgi:hypothetical protein